MVHIKENDTIIEIGPDGELTSFLGKVASKHAPAS